MKELLALRGKTILITRAAHQAGDLVRMVEERGGVAVVFPTINIQPPDSWDAYDRALDGLYMYNGLIFTSVNGVEYFFRRYQERGCSADELKKKSVYVVGEKTRHAAEQAGLSVTAMPERFTASDLATKLQMEDLHGKSFLFPRGNLGSDVLADNLKLLGANVDSLVVYKTVRPPEADVDSLRSRFRRRSIDVMTFVSPSAFRNFMFLFSKKEMTEYCEFARIAVIGPVTARTVEEYGIRIDIIPKKSTSESLVDAIGEHLTPSEN